MKNVTEAEDNIYQVAMHHDMAERLQLIATTLGVSLGDAVVRAVVLLGVALETVEAGGQVRLVDSNGMSRRVIIKDGQ